MGHFASGHKRSSHNASSHFGGSAIARDLIDAGGARLLATTVMDYIAAKNQVAPKIEGRILER